MSDFSLTLVLQIKTSKIINDMAKVQQKSEKISAFGGIFFVLDIFDRILSSVIDSHLGLRSRLIGYQYSEIIRAVFSVFCCGGDCMEDLNLYLKDVLSERPHTRVPSADTVLRGIEELATENISYTAEKTGNVYDFNTAEKLNQLLIKLLLATGQLAEGGEYDVDFDHQFLEAEKYDSKRTYKGFDGYSPGVFTIGGLIAPMLKEIQMAPFFLLCVISTDSVAFIIDKTSATTEIYVYMEFLTVLSLLERN